MSQKLYQTFGSEQLEVEMLLTKTEKTAGKRGLIFKLEHDKFTIFTRHPSGDVT